MKRVFLILAAVALCATSGCTGLRGWWQLKGVSPSGAVRLMPIRCIHFVDDTSFSAEVLGASGLESTSGNYEWNPKTREVTLHFADRAAAVYRADVCGPCNTLQFWNWDDPERWRATFIRHEPNTPCSPEPLPPPERRR